MPWVLLDDMKKGLACPPAYVCTASYLIYAGRYYLDHLATSPGCYVDMYVRAPDRLLSFFPQQRYIRSFICREIFSFSFPSPSEFDGSADVPAAPD